MRKLFGRINNKTFFYPKKMTTYHVLPSNRPPRARWGVDKVYAIDVTLERWPTRQMQLNGARRFYEASRQSPSEGVEDMFLSRQEAVDALGRIRIGQPFLLSWRRF